MYRIKQWLRRLFGNGDSYQEGVPANATPYRGRRKPVSLGSAWSNSVREPDIPERIYLEKTMKINVTPAHGGLVVVIEKYNEKSDCNSQIVHVIHDSDDVASGIGQIISMELLRY